LPISLKNFTTHADVSKKSLLHAGGEVMKSQEYRSKAIECLESAPWIADMGAKNALIKMALYWLRLADLHDASQDRSGVAAQFEGNAGLS
jgi:hypothetical protein